jgi:hypothetical protein
MFINIFPPFIIAYFRNPDKKQPYISPKILILWDF